jgi:hypothetical protein
VCGDESADPRRAIARVHREGRVHSAPPRVSSIASP